MTHLRDPDSFEPDDVPPKADALTDALTRLKEMARGAPPLGPPLKDSGTRRAFGTGAQRDAATGKGRFDLLPMHAMARLARIMEKGAAKYDARNWEKGIPLSVFADCASRHLAKAIAGYDDEDHLDQAHWNIACMIETRERIKLGVLPQELDDLPHTCVGLKPLF